MSSGDESISRSIVSFGRYPERRPPGLIVSPDGAMSLSNLMAVWGNKQGLTSESVTQALEAHMFRNARPGVLAQPRFSLYPSQGDVTILVSNSRRQQSGEGTQSRSSAPPMIPWSASQWVTPPPPPESSRKPFSAFPSTPKKRKLDVPEETPRAGSVPKAFDANPSATRWKAATKVSSPWNSEAWKKQDSKSWNSWDSDWTEAKGGSSWTSSGWKTGLERDSTEKAHRFLGFLLKQGRVEYGIAIDSAGWASLADVAWAFETQRPEFGIKDSDSLTNLLTTTDTEGRFEVVRGHIRKVAREERKGAGSRASTAAWGKERQEQQEQQKQQDPSQEQQEEKNGGPEELLNYFEVQSNSVVKEEADWGGEALTEAQSSWTPQFDSQSPDWKKHSDRGKDFWCHKAADGSKWIMTRVTDKPMRADDLEDEWFQ